MFYYNYIIQSLKDKKWYTGIANDLRKRFKEHNQGKALSTKGRGPFKPIYYEACLNKNDAAAREIFLKTGMGKRYLKNRLKRFLFLTGLIILGILVSFNAQAGTADNVYGFAWSENIGWISFNSTNCDANGDGLADGTIAGCPAIGSPIPNYGVSLDSVTGLFSGYAWSENIGWIHFAPLGPYPSSPNYSACLDFGEGGKVCDELGGNKAGGWARALAYGDGWDGWMKLRGSNYGVNFNDHNGEFSGWAWGSDVMGWISFNRINCDANKDGLSDGNPVGCPPAGTPISNYKVVTIAKLPPQVKDLNEIWNYCTDSKHPTLNWTYLDGIQAAYWIQIDGKSGDFKDKDLVVNTGEITSPGQSYATTYDFQWNQKYYWHVKAKNQQGTWSNWSNTDNFNTIKHAYPKPNFSSLPLKPMIDETVQFTDQSEAYGGAIIQEWKWIFQDGNPLNSTLQNPQAKFVSAGSKIVSLGVRDSDDYDCGITDPADATAKILTIIPKVKWKEILPW